MFFFSRNRVKRDLERMGFWSTEEDWRRLNRHSADSEWSVVKAALAAGFFPLIAKVKGAHDEGKSKKLLLQIEYGIVGVFCALIFPFSARGAMRDCSGARSL